MELSWRIKIRIGLALVAGGVILGWFGWPLVGPDDTVLPFLMQTSPMGIGGAFVLGVVCFVISLIGYFALSPYGGRIAVLIVPAGLGVWGFRSGEMVRLLQLYQGVEPRVAIFSQIKWEGFLWLGIVGLSIAGVLAGVVLRSIGKSDTNAKDIRKNVLQVLGMAPFDFQGQIKNPSAAGSRAVVTAIIAITGTVLVAQFLIGLLAQNVRVVDPQMGSLVGQPSNGQIAFAVILAFLGAGFLVKKVVDGSYLWPVIGSGLMNWWAVRSYARPDILEFLYGRWPEVFFPHAVLAITPVQMVSYGTLGALAGFWLAIRYELWRSEG